jgi:hypothetical protein
MPASTRNKAFGAAALLSGLAFAACSEDEAAPPALPEGPPDLGIVSLQAPGVIARAGSCFAVEPPNGGPETFAVVLKTDKGGRIPLLLPDGSVPRFWTFQPPLGCAGAQDCGFVLVLLDPASSPCAAKPEAVFSTIATGPSIPIRYDDLRKALDGQFGPKTIRVEFWPSEDKPDPKHCRSTEIEGIDFEPSCGPRDAGTRDGAIPTEGGDASSDATDANGDGPARDASASDVHVPEASVPDATTSDASGGKVDATVSDAKSDANSADGAG